MTVERVHVIVHRMCTAVSDKLTSRDQTGLHLTDALDMLTALLGNGCLMCDAQLDPLLKGPWY